MSPDKLKEHWIGKKVISVSNSFEANPDDNSLRVGIVTDLIPVSKSMILIPKVKFDGEEVLCFSVVMDYSDELLTALNKLGARERWTILQSFALRFSS